MSESPSRGDAFTVGNGSPESQRCHQGYSRFEVDWSGFNGAKCAKVQLHLR